MTEDPVAYEGEKTARPVNFSTSPAVMHERDQQIKIEALRAAAVVVGNMPTDYIELLDYEKATLAAAERFRAWLSE